MKFAILITLVMSAGQAFADMTCDGHELMPGNAGRSGTLVMTENPSAIRWQGDTTDVLGPATLCGVELNSTTVCQKLDHSRGPTISVRIMCADKDRNPLDNKIGEGYFAYSNVNGVGRFGCSNTSGDTKVEKIIEINNCR